MNILMIHNSYQLHGGEDESFESEVRMLRDADHFVDLIHLTNENVGPLGRFNVALQSIWSKSSYNLVEKKLREGSFDVLHVQNFFPLVSPSVYSAARKHGVAVIQTLRNYRLLCPGATLFRNGRICEDCLHKTIKFPGIIHACYRNSVFASAAVATMTGFHALKGTWQNSIDLYISLSESSRDKYVQAGFPADKVIVKGNFVYPDPGPGDGSEGYVLFAGRLTPEKGVETLLAAWDLLETPTVLKIVGDGLLAPQVQAFCRRKQNVEWLGARSASEVKDLMGAAKVLVFPSQWYEPFGRVAIESFAKGTPVIASGMAAMAEIVEDNINGMLFRPGDPKDLASKLQWALDHPSHLHTMRQAARGCYQLKYTASQNLKLLIHAYGLAQRNANVSRSLLPLPSTNN